MFSTPVTSSNRMLPTSSSSDRRSSAWASERAGGHANSFGSTDQSLASTTGTSASPSPTCTPWLSRYSHDGPAGQAKYGRRSRPGSAGKALPGKRGSYAA